MYIKHCMLNCLQMHDGINLLDIDGRSVSKYAINLGRRFIDPADLRRYMLNPQRHKEGARTVYPVEFRPLLQKIEGKHFFS